MEGVSNNNNNNNNSTNITRVVKLKRANGKLVQGCDVYIGRRFTKGGWDLPQSKWANPFPIGTWGCSPEVVVNKYRQYILNKPDLLDSLHELEGKTLGCWCKPGLCHGDVLLELIRDGKKNKEINK